MTDVFPHKPLVVLFYLIRKIKRKAAVGSPPIWTATISFDIGLKEVGVAVASDVFVDATLSGIAQLDLAVHGEPCGSCGQVDFVRS